MLISLTPLAAYYLQQLKWRLLVIWLTTLYSFGCVIALVTNSILANYTDKGIATYLAKQANPVFTHLYDLPIVAADRNIAAVMSFWLSGHPTIYTLAACATDKNQYTLWGQVFNQKVINH